MGKDTILNALFEASAMAEGAARASETNQWLKETSWRVAPVVEDARAVGVAAMTSAYTLAQEIHTQFDVPVFPVLIKADLDTGKWQKNPLAKWGSIAVDTPPDEFNWGRANAVSVPMGQRSGLIALDVDSYKASCDFDAWSQLHELPPTRTHGTASGGRHLIYRMPEGIDFGNRAPKVHGLDVRGSGGFIVWADTLDRYSVIDPRDPPSSTEKPISV